MRSLVIAAAAWFCLGAGAVAAANEVPEEIRLRIVEQINRDRAAAGVPAVKYAPELSRAADPHCQEMLQHNYTSHWNRAGWPPYLRYSQAGIRDNTSENVASFWCSNCHFHLEKLLPEALQAHARFMEETPPYDGHRKSILNPTHTHVGIGLAYGPEGFRMVELFAGRYVDLDPLPATAKVNQTFRISGSVRAKGFDLMAISVFYEPPPQPMSLAQLKETYSYALPQEEKTERPSLEGASRRYTDGTLGTVRMGAGGRFEVPLIFWKQQPGVYTVAVWVRREREAAFLGALWSVMVQQ